MTAGVNIQTPFSGYEQLSGTINHSGSIDNFASSAEIVNGQNKLSCDARFSKLGPITGEIIVTTPFKGLKVNRVAFSHDGTRKNFMSHAEILFNNSRSESDLTFSSIDSIEGNFVMKSPYFENVKGSFSAQGEVSSLRSQANIMYGKTNIIDGMLTFVTAPTTRGSFSVQAMQTPRIQGTFTHEGQRSNFHTQAEMSYGRQRIELDTAVNLVDDLSGNVILKVPYIDDIQAAIVHTARRSGFRSHIEGALGAQKVETDVTFSSKSGMSITAT
ncbi:hypothetical protein KUTeg_005889 [Tegillarca granosa]|uniref:Adhesin domain-containing protein n=1 Tax=Tegillarca granosa TaxID=220873 RepID=A0ABQ9FGV7_TEGGR|nr:hypothetical protein KUTeg_005889 [Tegillarca granosa]